jgi:exopolyphosphatase/guanosine-5'-triphosphate,3'-diphosphate pyrophosphatase
MLVQIYQHTDSGIRIVDHIIPRWEWRTFGLDFGPAEQRFGALTPEKVQHSSEIYLLVEGTDANVKYRDHLFDIKQLERVDENGLEQWRPVFKKLFPLSAAEVAQVRSALGLPDGPIDGGAASLGALLAGLQTGPARVRAIKVEKTRGRYSLHECAAELTEVVADGKKIRTVAIEDEDPVKVNAAMRAMGLGGFPNISYPRGLKQLVGVSR